MNRRLRLQALVVLLLASAATSAHAQAPEPATPLEPSPPAGAAPTPRAPPGLPAEPGPIDPPAAAPPGAEITPADEVAPRDSAPAPPAEPAETPPPAAAAEPVVASVASAEAPSAEAADEATSPHDRLPKYSQYRLGFEAGGRYVAAADPSFDPYASTDALTSFALAATWLPLERGPLSAGAIGEWSIGGASGDARGVATGLLVQRASIGAQGRLAIGQRVYLHAKVAPALLYAASSIDDPAVDRPLEAHGFTWGLDATGGAAVLIGRAGHPDAPAFRLWIVGELGYAFAGAVELDHAPEELEDDPRRYGQIALAPLSTDGVLSRLAVAMTF